VSAIRRHEGTQRLARIPNLLTMIALIHRIRASLPDGRAKLYDDIAEAYLHSIDDFRGLNETHYSLAQKKRWLAYVAFQMQKRRAESPAAGEDSSRPASSEPAAQEILVDSPTAERWLAESMAQDLGKDAARTEAAKFLDYIGRRSGLLLPRGRGQYAFTHLTFQEYFAACYLADALLSLRWPKKAPAGASEAELQAYANDPAWRETLVLLFELLADRPPCSEDLVEILLGQDCELLARDDESRAREHAARLLAEASVDVHSGLGSAESRARWWGHCWQWEVRTQQLLAPFRTPSGTPVARALTGASRQFATWDALHEIAWGVTPERLCLIDCSGIADLGPLGGLGNLRDLHLIGCSGVVDLGPVGGLGNLSDLSLIDCSGIVDLGPLGGLGNLSSLSLSGCSGVVDLGPVGGLGKLSSLSLSGCSGVVDLGPVGGLGKLSSLSLSGCSGVVDLGPVGGLGNLRGLYLIDCSGIADLGPLGGLGNLSSLDLSGCSGVVDLGPLGGLGNLRDLYLSGCSGVVDLGPLGGLGNLRVLDLSGCSGVVDLGPVGGLGNLRDLYLIGCSGIVDLGPVGGLGNLSSLYLIGCSGIVDLGPLTSLAKLKRLHVADCPNLRGIPKRLRRIAES